MIPYCLCCAVLIRFCFYASFIVGCHRFRHLVDIDDVSNDTDGVCAVAMIGVVSTVIGVTIVVFVYTNKQFNIATAV